MLLVRIQFKPKQNLDLIASVFDQLLPSAVAEAFAIPGQESHPKCVMMQYEEVSGLDRYRWDIVITVYASYHPSREANQDERTTEIFKEVCEILVAQGMEGTLVRVDSTLALMTTRSN
jgi:hypothetical protein